MRFFKILGSRTKRFYEIGVTIGKTCIAIVYLYTALLLVYTFAFSKIVEYWVSFWEASPALWLAIILGFSAWLIMKFPSNPTVQLYTIYIDIEYLQGSIVGFDYLRAFMEYEGAYFPQVWLIFIVHSLVPLPTRRGIPSPSEKAHFFRSGPSSIP